MSQHIFRSTHNGSPVEVQIGFDRPTQCYYAVVSPVIVVNGQEALDDPIYSNLEEECPETLTFDFFKFKLRELGIEIPDGLREAVEEDRRMGRMNHEVRY